MVWFEINIMIEIRIRIVTHDVAFYETIMWYTLLCSIHKFWKSFRLFSTALKQLSLIYKLKNIDVGYWMGPYLTIYFVLRKISDFFEFNLPLIQYSFFVYIIWYTWCALYKTILIIPFCVVWNEYFITAGFYMRDWFWIHF